MLSHRRGSGAARKGNRIMAKAPKLNSQPQLVTANDLKTGDVVYLTQSAGWSRRIDDASLVPNADAGAPLLAVAEAQAKMTNVTAPDRIPVGTAVPPPIGRASGRERGGKSR